MSWFPSLPFFRFFVKNIFGRKTRSWALFLAMGGPIVSAFSLIVLQSVMGGLQKNLVDRAKSIEGTARVRFSQGEERSFVLKVLSELRQQRDLEAFAELTLELLLKTENEVTPVIVHGPEQIGALPAYLAEFKGNTLVGYDLARRLGLQRGMEVDLISPLAPLALLGDVPRERLVEVDDYMITDMPEIDGYHLWTRPAILRELTRKRALNNIQIHSPLTSGAMKELRQDLKAKYGERVHFQTWEEMNAPLVWSLNLEHSVMLFLFVAMTFLISLAIGTGFLIYFDKIRTDITGLWIMGASLAKIRRNSFLFLHLFSSVTSLLGLIPGVLFLKFIQAYGQDMMPEMFVERDLPVNISLSGLLIAFFMPYLISLIFSMLAFKQFQKNSDQFLERIRSAGQ